MLIMFEYVHFKADIEKNTIMLINLFSTSDHQYSKHQDPIF